MNKYNCIVIFDASSTVSVEAETPEAAAQIAENIENIVQENQHLCYQFANTFETGDSIGVYVYDKDYEQKLLDTTYRSQSRAWVGLTDEEIKTATDHIEPQHGFYWIIAKSIEAKLKEKNT